MNKLITTNLELEPDKPGPNEPGVWLKDHPLVQQIFEEKMTVGGMVRGATTVYTGIITHIKVTAVVTNTMADDGIHAVIEGGHHGLCGVLRRGLGDEEGF